MRERERELFCLGGNNGKFRTSKMLTFLEPSLPKPILNISKQPGNSFDIPHHYPPPCEGHLGSAHVSNSEQDHSLHRFENSSSGSSEPPFLKTKCPQFFQLLLKMLWFLDEPCFCSSLLGCQGPSVVPTTPGTPGLSQQMLGTLAQHFLGASIADAEEK